MDFDKGECTRSNERLTVNRRIGIELKKEYSSMYSMRWEIDGTFSILEGIMGSENIWYVSNRDYDNIIGLRVVAYNLTVISNIVHILYGRQLPLFLDT